MKDQDQKINKIVGIAYIGCVAAGTASLVAALFPFFIGDFTSAGIFLTAAALSFGLLAIAILKNSAKA
jgi:hypothetical protein